MASHLSLWKRADIFLGFIESLFRSTLTALCSPFRGPNTPKTFRRHVSLDLVRRVFTRLSVEQLQFVAGSTESNYIAWSRAKKLPYYPCIHVPAADDDTKAFWVGNPNAQNVILYFHGGGFAMPASPGHFDFLHSLLSSANRGNEEQNNTSALFLQYDLTPKAQYPRQLEQSVELLRYTLDQLKKSPQDIMLMGDSVGGNVVLGILSHLLHPHPKIDPVRLTAPLKGAAASSPVVALNTQNPRFKTHEQQDPAGASTIQKWMEKYLGSAKPDGWNEPLKNGQEWWIGLQGILSGLLITVASNEMMADDICKTFDKVESVYKGAELFKSESDFHAEPANGPSFGLLEGEAAKCIISWYCAGA